MARRAGIQQATRPTVRSRATAKARTKGSRGGTPQSWLEIIRERAKLAARPMMIPKASNRRPPRSTIFTTSMDRAPRAMRIPNS